MKTALRTYHPVPSLQKTDGNAQDAPRIKNCLKAALLPTELKSNPPSTPEEVLAKLVCVFFSILLRTMWFNFDSFVLESRAKTFNERSQSYFCPCQSRYGKSSY